MTVCSSACSSSSLGAPAWTNTGTPSAPHRTPAIWPAQHTGACGGVQHQAVQVNGGGAAAALSTQNPPTRVLWLHFRLAADPKRWISVTAPLSASIGLESGLPEQMARDHAVHHLQHGCHQFGLRRQQHAQRDGQRQHPLAHRHVRDDVVYQMRRGLRHASGSARGAEPPPLATEGQQLVVPAIPAAQAQEPVGQDTALQEGVELVLDELRQVGTGGLFGLSEERRGMLLHQAVQRGLLGSVARIVDRGAIAMRPRGLVSVGLHALGMGNLGWCSFSGRAGLRIRLWGDQLLRFQQHHATHHLLHTPRRPAGGACVAAHGHIPAHADVHAPGRADPEANLSQRRSGPVRSWAVTGAVAYTATNSAPGNNPCSERAGGDHHSTARRLRFSRCRRRT